MEHTRWMYVRLPVDLVERLDRVAGGRTRSAVVGGALAAYLEREELLASIHAGAGGLAAEEAAQWPGDDAVDRWIGALRGERPRPTTVGMDDGG